MGFQSFQPQNFMRPAPQPTGLASVGDMLDAFFARRQQALQAELAAQVDRERTDQAAINSQRQTEATLRGQDMDMEAKLYSAQQQRRNALEARAWEARKEVGKAAAAPETAAALDSGNIDRANAPLAALGTRWERQEFQPQAAPEVGERPQTPKADPRMALWLNSVADVMERTGAVAGSPFNFLPNGVGRAGPEVASMDRARELDLMDQAAGRDYNPGEGYREYNQQLEQYVPQQEEWLRKKAEAEAIAAKNVAGKAAYDKAPTYKLAPISESVFGMPVDLDLEYSQGATRNAANASLETQMKTLRESNVPFARDAARILSAALLDGTMSPKEVSEKAVEQVNKLMTLDQSQRNARLSAGRSQDSAAERTLDNKIDRLEGSQQEWWKRSKMDSLLDVYEKTATGLANVDRYRAEGSNEKSTVALRDALYSTAKAITGPGVLTDQEYKNTVTDTAGVLAWVQSLVATKTAGGMSDAEVAKLELYLRDTNKRAQRRAMLKSGTYEKKFMNPKNYYWGVPKGRSMIENFLEADILDQFGLTMDDYAQFQRGRGRGLAKSARPGAASSPGAAPPAPGPAAAPPATGLVPDDDDDLERLAGGLGVK